MTYCAWFKVDGFTKDKQCIIGTNGSYRLSRNGETDSMRLWNDKLGGTLAGTSDVADNQWHHACGVVERIGETTTVKLYIDGVLENSNSDSDLIKPLATDLIIGADGSGYPGREWNGMIDDVRFYNYALSDDDILNLSNGLEPGEIICIVRPAGDLNKDCKIDFADYAILADNWLKQH
jgi:hypothetical protein